MFRGEIKYILLKDVDVEMMQSWCCVRVQCVHQDSFFLILVPKFEDISNHFVGKGKANTFNYRVRMSMDLRLGTIIKILNL